LESAEACVTTHLPKRAAPKKDDAQASACPISPIPCRCGGAAQGGDTLTYWEDWVRNE